MSQTESDQVLAFDTLYTNNHIQMLKVLLPHLPRGQKNQFAVFIKYMELQYTITLTEKQKNQINICTASYDSTPIDWNGLLKELQPYCTTTEKRKMSQIKEMMNTFQMLQEMDKYKEMFSSISSFQNDESNESEGASNNSTNGIDFTQMLKNILSPEQQAMFEMFQGASESE